MWSIGFRRYIQDAHKGLIPTTGRRLYADVMNQLGVRNYAAKMY